MNLELYIELLEREVFRLRGEDYVEPQITQKKKKHPLLRELKPESKEQKLVDDPTEIKSARLLPEDVLESEASEEFWDESSAKEMPMEEFNELFEGNKRLIEKETYAYTTSWDEWVQSDIKYMIPKKCSPAFEVAVDKKSYATAESFMFDGKVFAMDRKKPQVFSSPEEAMEYIKTLFAVLIVYQGVSMIDGKTVRYHVVGCKEEEGTVPTHGL